MEWLNENYRISTDQKLLSMERVMDLLRTSYWASQRPLETIEKSISNSLCFGVYDGDEQIGFARVITDYATLYWLGDVIIDERYRGKGLGKDLLRCIVKHDDLKKLRGILATTNAHSLYRQFGFETIDGIYMRRERISPDGL